MQKLLTLWIFLVLVASSRRFLTSAAPVDHDSLDKYPVMVPVSSTVIPVVNLFGPPRVYAPGSAMIPKRNSAFYLSPARRARLLERSSRPDEPVRLITKNSKLKDNANETL